MATVTVRGQGMTPEERTRHEAKIRFRAFELPHMSREERDERLVELVGENVFVEYLRYENDRLKRRISDRADEAARANEELRHLRGNIKDLCDGLRREGRQELADRLANAILSRRRVDYQKLAKLMEAL